MRMRALLIDDETRTIAQTVVDFASKRDNWYDPLDRTPGWMDRLPGHREELRCTIPHEYRCVFSYTADAKSGLVLRHLSVSVPGALPGMQAIYEIARMFGFTDSSEDRVIPPFPPSWILHQNPKNMFDDECIVVLEDTGLKP